MTETRQKILLSMIPQNYREIFAEWITQKRQRPCKECNMRTYCKKTSCSSTRKAYKENKILATLLEELKQE